MSERRPIIAVIGGSGLYEIEGLSSIEEISVDTPFGAPSDTILHGRLGETEIYFLPRHGRGHYLSPGDVPFRANIYALRKLGVEQVLAISAVGSMREHIKPGDLVVVDQFFDRTCRGPSTFFGSGLVAHVGFADPVCERMRGHLLKAARRTGATVHDRGTYLCMEGPAFSTRAESRVYRGWGMDIIGMTNITEAKLAREAELCYTTLALVTDYDCWHETEEDVSVRSVLKTLRRNTNRAKEVIRCLAEALPAERGCPCPSALQYAILTHPEAIGADMRARLDLLVRKYLPAAGRESS